MKYELKAFNFKETIIHSLEILSLRLLEVYLFKKAAVHELKEQSLRALKRQFLC